MQFDDEEDVPLKKWVTKRLEDISDADSDVLADYVLALVKSDDPDDQVRNNCLEALEDFLGEHTVKFVDDILKAVQTKSYLPGYVAPRSVQESVSTFNPRSGPGNGNILNGASHGSSAQSRKRAFHETDNDGFAEKAPPGERVHKQMRRGGTRGNRQDMSNGREFRPSSGQPPTGSNQNMFSAMGTMPPMPPGFPLLDPNNPMAAILAMQAMGFPSLPGFPTFPQTGQNASPTGFKQNGLGSKISPKIRERCRDYDTKGFCAAGNSCPYDHGNDRLVVPAISEEYDPTNASLASDFPSSTQVESNNSAPLIRGRRNDRGRGRGGRLDRGGRAAFSSAGPNNDRSISSIVVEQIPEEKFNEEAIREFFSEFGTIEEVTLQAYKRLAIVKYTDWDGAKNAYDSPKVIFDNRFVKVYWFKPATNSSTQSAAPSQRREDSEMIDPEEFARKQADAQKIHEEKLKKLKEAENQKEELEMRIKAQAEERKALLEKLAQKTGAVSRSPPLPHQSEHLPSSSISATPSNSTTTAVKPTSQTEILRAKLAELEAEAESLGINPDDTNAAAPTWSGYHRGARGRGRSFGRGFGPRGRGAAYRGRGALAGGAVFRLDNRPRTVAISGPDWSEGSGKDEALREHLMGIGADFEGIVKRPADVNGETANGADSGKEVVEIAFSQRYIAENFMASAKDGIITGLGKVEFAWVPNRIAPVNPVVTNGSGVGVGVGATHIAKQGDQDASGDSMMAGGGNTTISKAVEVDYDVADDDDDRWMAT